MSTKYSELPQLPAPLKGFLPYLADHSDVPVQDLLLPYRHYDSKVREIFAQEPDHPALAEDLINVVPIFDKAHALTLRARARNMEAETEQQKARFIMPLKAADRKEIGSPAVVPTLKGFRDNFNVFSELSLSELDWNNVVAAGSSVVSALLPVPEEYNTSKRSLRKYYHEISAPASDVDLFLYGLTEQQAVEKMKQIESSIRDSILTETTTIRTKNALTIASQYPTRHVQIVLRIYKSVSEILTGFDVDCSCAAYDGKQVYASPRAIAAYITQINTIDLGRRSPSYENRLSKYSHRGFEIYWPQLDRDKVDPTIFERSFNRTNGLARLLVLEKLPKATDRDAYMDQRRRERGRPPIDRYRRNRRQLHGNIKNEHEDEVAEWVEEDEVSDYHTFTIPYGERFHAKRIEKVLYNRDLLLNAEWNKPKDREVNLHRHPAFFGRVKDVIEDCCGSCPRSVTPEEQEVAEEEARRYVSGRITFMKDDPGRQAIGSFNPITDTDWTEMAYVGDTELLCNSIVDCDLERVKDWFTVDGADPNCRDYTGRTPLQLAVISSTPEIVQYLVDSGARLVARMADGRTALHLAAALGKLEMVRILLFRSEANEAAEAEKEDARRKARTAAGQSQDQRMTGMGSSQESKSNEDESEEEDEEASDEDYEVTDGEEEGDVKSSTSGSYVKVSQKPQVDNAIPDDSEGDDPDVYDVNVLAWDTSASALHLAIINGHVDVVKELVETFGADVLLPIKLLNSYGNTPRAAILTLALALCLPLGLAKQMAITLLKLGASSAQADLNQHTAFEYFVNHDIRMLDVLVEQDRPSVQRVLNHLAISGSTWNPWASTPLVNAIEKGDVKAFLRLLGLGANTSIDYADWAKSIKLAFEQTSRPNQMDEKQFAQSFSQPLITAISNEQPSMANELLNRGADPNTLAPSGYRCIQDEYSRSYTRGQSTLDLVQEKMKNLRESHDSLTHGFSHHNSSVYHHAHQSQPTKPKPLESDDHYLGHFTEGTYQHWAAKRQLQREKASYESNLATYNKAKEEKSEWKGLKEKMEAVQALTEDMQDLEQELIKRGAKTLGELYPDVKIQEDYGRTTHHTFTPSAVKPKKFEISVGFQVPDLTAASKAAYIDIFEAAWRGDIDTIKKYTLGTWGSENKEESKEENREGSKESPLVVAVQDLAGSTPFSVAVFRGHLGTAGAILEIAQAQYAPKEPVQKRHAMDENEGDSDVDFESDGDVRVYGEIVDERFTIDNIGEVATQVKSQVHPQALLTWNTNISSFSEIPGLFKIADQYDANMKIYMDKITIGGNKMDRRIQSGVSSSSMFDVAVMNDDLDLLTWLLDLYSKVAKVEASDENVLQAFSSARDNSFQLATRLGRIRHLTELIKRTGAGIPFQELAETSGVEVKKQPRYYQGLTVYGRKRADWAASARGEFRTLVKKDMLPPLLLAAQIGNLESVEWFLSDTPTRCYSEFAEANSDSLPVKTLAQATGGFDAAVSKFLNSKNALAIHSAVLSMPGPDKAKLVQYLIQSFPEHLDSKSIRGYTPLHLAFRIHHPRLAKLLIDSGADQTCRDVSGNNLVHTVLWPEQGIAHQNLTRTRELLDLVDPRLRPSLFTERCSEDPGSLTPLHRWIINATPYGHDSKELADLLGLTLEYSKGVELDTINGAGDTPLHTIVSQKNTRFLNVIMEYRADLLHRENAIGRTPADVRFDKDNAMKLSDPPTLGNKHRRNLVDQNPDEFLQKDAEREEWADWGEAWAKALGRGSKKRKLVSLFEANEVARRLTAREASKKRRMEYGVVVEEDEQSEHVVDELQNWYGKYVGWDEVEPQAVS